jgi:hypothetical protein
MEVSMKLLVPLVIVAGLAGLGFYQGWFHLGSQNSAGKSDITLTVDKDKMNADEQKAKDKVQGLGRRADDKAAAAAEKTK